MKVQHIHRGILSLTLAVCSASAGVAFGAAAQQAQPSQGNPLQTTQDWNRRLQELRKPEAGSAVSEYRLGPQDLVEISVFDAQELNRTVRVSASGEIYLPLLEEVQAAGLTPRELERVLQELLRRKYMKDPHVSVFVKEMESHNVSVFGAVKKPGVYQIRGSKSLIEVLSLAAGLDADAGDSVLVVRGRSAVAPASSAESAGAPGAAPRAAESRVMPEPAGESIEVNLKALLESGDPQYDVLVHPGDTVKVSRAGIVYVVGEVRKPGGFLMRTNENVSVLQAIALAEGITRTAARGSARIIRTDEKTGKRTEIPLDLNRVLASKAPDPMLQAKDILFVPNSAAKSVLYRGSEAALSVVSGVLIYRSGR